MCASALHALQRIENTLAVRPFGEHAASANHMQRTVHQFGGFVDLAPGRPVDLRIFLQDQSAEFERRLRMLDFVCALLERLQSCVVRPNGFGIVPFARREHSASVLA